MIRGIHHTAISTPNLERALAFYRDLLGLQPIAEFAWPKGTEVADRITGLRDSAARVAMLKAGNAIVELFEYESPSPQPGDPQRPVADHGYTHLCFDVTDLDAEYERLRAAGMVFHCPQSPRVPGRPGVCISETILVTDRGSEVLSNFRRELIVL